MSDIVLFGATGFTGRLTAEALASRGADFAIAGRDTTKLNALAERTGHPSIHQVAVGETERLTKVLRGSRVLISCVGPFSELGDTAVEAALRAGVHYLDSTGEGAFIDRLLADYHDRALKVGVALAPALGFDEVPGDLALTIAVQDMAAPRVRLTYALPTQASTGTIKSALSIVATKGPWIVDGVKVDTGVGRRQRWAPMPEPLGPRLSTSFPLAEGRLAPLHLDLRGLETYVTVGRAQGNALRLLAPALGPGLSWGPARGAIRIVINMLAGTEGPSDSTRREGRWTVLAEAIGQGNTWRNVIVQGTDVYGLTASLLAAGATEMARDGYENSGVVAPVEALGEELTEKELRAFDVDIRIVD